MKVFLTIVGIVVAAAAVAVTVMHFLPTVAIREDFVCED